MKVANATASENKRGKIQKAVDILRFAFEEKRHGTSGVVVKTGEALQAAGCSDSRARQLMVEIAGVVDSAETETPGGKQQKRLRIRFEGRDFEDVHQELLEAWGEA